MYNLDYEDNSTWTRIYVCISTLRNVFPWIDIIGLTSVIVLQPIKAERWPAFLIILKRLIADMISSETLFQSHSN